MLCTNCASPAFCKTIACFHTPLIKKKKKSKKIYFANPSLWTTWFDRWGCASRLTWFVFESWHGWAARCFLVQKSWTRSVGQGKAPTPKPVLPAWPHGTTRSLLMVLGDTACRTGKAGPHGRVCTNRCRISASCCLGHCFQLGWPPWHWNLDKASTRVLLSHHLPAKPGDKFMSLDVVMWKT